MAATIKDIAKETGLGLATISAYINGGNVREKNRVKIEEAIEKLHYEVNEVARGLKTNRTKTIGVLIPELNNTFCAEIVTSMEDVLRRSGYATIICDCRTDPGLELESVDFLFHKRVDGIINMPVDVSGRNLKMFEEAGKPIVLIDRKIGALSCDCVFVDNRDAAKKAVRKLIENGHKKIGIIAGPKGIFTAKERLDGYYAALKEAHIPSEERLVYFGDYTLRGGREGLKKLTDSCPDMTALFITNYEMTMGTVIGVNEQGIRIPEDLSLIGFDNLSFARACTPPLTIVEQPTEEIGRMAAEIILRRLGEKENPASSEGRQKISTKNRDVSLFTRIAEGKSVRSL